MIIIINLSLFFYTLTFLYFESIFFAYCGNIKIAHLLFHQQLYFI